MRIGGSNISSATNNIKDLCPIRGLFHVASGCSLLHFYPVVSKQFPIGPGISVRQGCDKSGLFRDGVTCTPSPNPCPIFPFDTGRSVSHLLCMDSLKVKQLAQRVAPDASPKEITRIVRQLRHWTLMSVLRAAGQVHVGAGRHREYPTEAVYIAAILIELAGIGLAVDALFPVGVGLYSSLNPKSTNWTKDHARFWRDAIDGKRRVYLTLSIRRASIETGLSIYDPDAPNCRYPVAKDDTNAIIIDLTKLFRKLA